MNAILRRAIRLVSLNKLNVHVKPQKTRFKMFQFKYYFISSTVCTHFGKHGKIEKDQNKMRSL